MTGIAREGLERSVPFAVREDEASGSGDGLTLDGYAAVFNQETEINSWEGNFVETISPGAFKKTIRERTPVLQFDHGRHPLVGSIPIGSIESLSEDSEGLHVLARMAENWLMEPLRESIKNKSVSGMSFRFEVVKDEWRDNTGKVLRDQEELWRLLWEPGDRGPIKRTLKELKVHELGPVVFPAYEGTSVSLRSTQMAQTVMGDRELVHQVRSSLARDSYGPYNLNSEFETDRELRMETARAILFGYRNVATVAVDKASAGIFNIPQIPTTNDISISVNDVTEPSTRDTQVNDGEPQSQHSQKIVDPHLRAKMQSFTKRAGLRLGYLPEED